MIDARKKAKQLGERFTLNCSVVEEIEYGIIEAQLDAFDEAVKKIGRISVPDYHSEKADALREAQSIVLSLRSHPLKEERGLK